MKEIMPRLYGRVSKNYVEIKSIGGEEFEAESSKKLLKALSEGGRFFRTDKLLLHKMHLRKCHRNVRYLDMLGDIDFICTGYAFDGIKWVRHSWGLADGRIVETTRRRKKYFGIQI